jgi:hypothetical protein
MEKAKEIAKLVLAAWVLGLLTWGAVMLSGYLVSIKQDAKTKAKIELMKIKNDEIKKLKAKDPKALAEYLNKLIGVN